MTGDRLKPGRASREVQLWSFFCEFPEGLLCLFLHDGVDKNPATQTLSKFLCEGIPVFVGQRCFNQRIGKANNGADSSNEGDIFDTDGDSLAYDFECSSLVF